MKQILIATKNVGKINEFKQLMARYGIEVLSLRDINDAIEIEEIGSTFEENALIKAREIATQYQTMTLADDSGLEIDALEGRPGVFSARYAGDVRCDDANMDKVLCQMKDVSDDQRQARFVCVLAMVNPKGKEIVVRGECEGLILNQQRGTDGFGYDPIFYLPKLGKTMAQLSKDEKNAISHRGKAFKMLEERMGEMI
jgi:XTP/dITP diphosphohydrolase